MVHKKRADIEEVLAGGMAEVQNELPKVLEGHEETGEAVQRVVEVCGPFTTKKQKKKRVSKAGATEPEKPEEEPETPRKLSSFEEQKKELLQELNTVGMGQVAKIRRLLKKIQELNEEQFRATMAEPMARHELMTLLAEQGLRLPLWVSPVGEHPPPLVGAIGANDAFKLAVGDYCAAYCEDMWILGEVRGIADNGRYEIRDVDDSDKPFTVLARRRVIPLPRYRADPERDSHAIFPKNAWILALYPQTTVFYKGVVEEPPVKATDPYKVSFDDSTFHGGFSPPLEVPQRYVLAFREVAYKPREGKGGEKEEKGKQLTKEEIKEQKEAERERKRQEKAEEKEREKAQRKADKKAEKERIKKEKKEAKQKEKEKKKKEKKKEKNRLAKERRLQRKKEEEERKAAEARGEEPETEEKDEKEKEKVDDKKAEKKEDTKRDEDEVEDEEEDEEEEEEKEDEEDDKDAEDNDSSEEEM